MNISPIRTDQDHALALARIGELFDAEMGTPEGDELDVLATLVEAYEERHYPIEPPTPVEAIRFRMEQMGMEDADLTNIVGRRGRVSEIMNGKRRLTLPMIRALNKRLKIPAESLISEYELV